MDKILTLRFKPGNNIFYEQDFSYRKGVPPDVDLVILPTNSMPNNTDRLTLVGPRHGGEPYGNGALSLSARELLGKVEQWEKVSPPQPPPPEPELTGPKASWKPEWEIPEFGYLPDDLAEDRFNLYLNDTKIGISLSGSYLDDIAHVFDIAREAVEWMKEHQKANSLKPCTTFYTTDYEALLIRRDDFLARAKKGPKP